MRIFDQNMTLFVENWPKMSEFGRFSPNIAMLYLFRMQITSGIQKNNHFWQNMTLYVENRPKMTEFSRVSPSIAMLYLFQIQITSPIQKIFIFDKIWPNTSTMCQKVTEFGQRSQIFRKIKTGEFQNHEKH